jgi:hypothetical protein
MSGLALAYRCMFDGCTGLCVQSAHCVVAGSRRPAGLLSGTAQIEHDAPAFLTTRLQPVHRSLRLGLCWTGQRGAWHRGLRPCRLAGCDANYLLLRSLYAPTACALFFFFVCFIGGSSVGQQAPVSNGVCEGK